MSTINYDGIEYRLTHSDAWVVYECTDKSFTRVEIPDFIHGKPVIAIGQMAFRRHPHLEEVYLPETVTKILPYSFASCNRLRKVKCSARGIHVDIGAFDSCSELTHFITQAFSSLDKVAFQGCHKLCVMHTQIAHLDSHAFRDCSSLTVPISFADNAVLNFDAFDDSGVTDLLFHGNISAILSLETTDLSQFTLMCTMQSNVSELICYGATVRMVI